MRQPSRNCKAVFTRKSFQPEAYEWCPSPNIYAGPNKVALNNAGKQPFFCTAVAGSQGQDWTSSYAYDLVVVNDQKERLAYVECGYSE